MKAPTPREITAEISRLEEIRPVVRPYSMFGDDHKEAIDAQIEVLKDDISEDDIYERSHNGDEDDETNEDKWPENVKDSALEARRWLDGDEKEPPSKGWEPLIKK